MLQAALYLIDVTISFFIIVFLLRFYMQILRVSFFNPVGQFVITLTDWAVRPLRRVIPAWGGLDLASLFPAFLLQLLLVGLMRLLAPRLILLDDTALVLFIFGATLLGLVRQSLHLLIGALILQAVLSWVGRYSPLSAPLDQLTRPFLNPIRRLLPPISGIDLSPLVAIVLAQAVLMLF